MSKQNSFSLIYGAKIRKQMDALNRRDYLMISRAIESRLSYEPHVEVRNRKRLRSPVMDATWQLRFGPMNAYRVFYNIDFTQRKVDLVSTGIKQRTRLFVDGNLVLLNPIV